MSVSTSPGLVLEPRRCQHCEAVLPRPELGLYFCNFECWSAYREGMLRRPWPCCYGCGNILGDFESTYCVQCCTNSYTLTKEALALSKPDKLPEAMCGNCGEFFQPDFEDDWFCCEACIYAFYPGEEGMRDYHCKGCGFTLPENVSDYCEDCSSRRWYFAERGASHAS